MQDKEVEFKGDEHSFASGVGHGTPSISGGTAVYAFCRKNAQIAFYAYARLDSSGNLGEKHENGA